MKRLLATSLIAFSLIVSVASEPSFTAAKPRLIKAVSLPAAVPAGGTVRISVAKWSAAVSRKYQWYLAGKAVKGATASTFRTTWAQRGKSLRVKETAKFASGKILTSTSYSVTIGRIAVVSDPSLMYVDDSMSAVQVYPPMFKPTNVTITYQWYRDGAAIQDATSDTYTFVGADSGAQISAKVSASLSGYVTRSLDTGGMDAPITDNAQTELLWSDEFNGSADSPFDTTFWTAQEGDGSSYGNAGWGNSERQWYLGSLAKHDGNGNLVITATRSGAGAKSCYYGNCEWLSSKLITRNKIGVFYGRMSIRMKSAAGTGTWPAFWTLGTDIGSVGWPNCGEIDILELAGRVPTTLWGTPHGPISGGIGAGGITQLAEDASADYHVYTVDWTPEKMVWYVDGRAYWTYRKSDNQSDWVFDKEQYLILNLAMGGTIGQGIDSNLQSTNMTIDWVRVYKVNGVGQVIQH